MADIETVTTESKLRPTVLGRALRLARGLSTMVIWVGAAFVAAGRVNWLRGWACAAAYVVVMSVTGAVVHRRTPGLLEARAGWRRKKAPLFDRVFVSIFMTLTLVQVVVAGLDAGRYRWLPLALWTFVPGLLLFLAGMGMVLWVFLTNPFAETVVRIQSERGHRVISEGPYRFVRHPMYVGSILMYPGTGLMFGSGWAVVVAGTIIAVLVWRTGREDRYLLENLDGYAEFARNTRYRLAPGVW